MTFRFDAEAALAKVQAQTPAHPTVPILPTAGAPQGQTVGTIGGVGRGQPQNAELRDAFAERAAIMQFDGEMPRVEAEAAAWAEVNDPFERAIAAALAAFEETNDPHNPDAWAS